MQKKNKKLSKGMFRRAIVAETLEPRQMLSGSPFLVKDIFPGPSDARIQKLTAAGGLVFFVASPSDDNKQLFRSDGTASGTIQLTQVVEGGGTQPYALTNVNGTLFFAATDPINGTELWKSDGTVAGTSLVKDIYHDSGTLGSLSSDPHGLVSYHNELYFAADDGDGEQIWKSDGTANGTVKITDISPGMSTSFDDLTVQGDTLYFFGDDVTHGPALWKSDGTAAGTTMVKATGTSAGGGGVGQLTAAANQLFYVAFDPDDGFQVWRSDGTPDGTHPVKIINPGVTDTEDGPLWLTTIGNAAYFSASDGSFRQLYRSDGTDAGTSIVKVINPGFQSNPTSLTNINGTLYFSAEDDTDGVELWSSDGTEAGTNLLTDINPGAASSNPAGLINVNGTLFFNADDGTHGAELWEHTTVPAATQMLGEINPSGDAFDNGSGLSQMATANGLVFFNATDGVNGEELWAYRAFTPSLGSTATTLLPDKNPSGAGAALKLTATVVAAGTPTGSVAFFDGATSLGTATLESDGTASLTVSSLTVGDHAITAQYLGDGSFGGSSSLALTQTIADLAATITVITPSENPGVIGDTITFSAKVTSSGAAPSGDVQFFDGNTQIGVVTLGADGTAPFLTLSLTAGIHSITAQYPGSSNTSPSTSPAVIETISTTPPSALVPDLSTGAGIIPANVVAGLPLKKSVPIVISNPTGALIKSSVTIVLYASPTGSVSGATALVTAVRKVAIKSAKMLKLRVTIPTIPSSLAAGIYTIIAQITDSSNLTRVAALPGTVTVAAPLILPVLSVGAIAPASIVSGKHGSITLIVINSGNIDAVGLMSVQINLSSNGSTPITGQPPVTATKRVKIKHGGVLKFQLHITVPLGLAAGPYFPLASVTLNGVSSTAAGIAFNVI